MSASHSHQSDTSKAKTLWKLPFARQSAIVKKRWNQTRIARTFARYSGANGSLLSSGMALTSLLSLSAALTVAVTAFMAVLGRNAAMRDALFSSIAQTIPHLLKTEEDPSGLINPDTLVMTGGLSATGIVALAIMTWSAVNVVGQFGTSIRAMFGLRCLPSSPLAVIARNALGALALGVSFIFGACLGVAVDMTGEALLNVLGFDSSLFSFVFLDVATVLLALFVYALVSWILISVVAQVRVPARQLIPGVFLIACASIVLRIAGTSVVGTVKGPLLATAATLITLVLWINLQVRVVLVICAWIANPPAPEKPSSGDESHFFDTPNYVTHSVPETLSWRYDSVSGEIRPEAVTDRDDLG